jgi:putative aminopeptidase FrvX
MYLKELSNLTGGSGDEKKVRDFIKEKIEGKVDEIRIDNVGNLIAFKRGKKQGLVIGILAHMDEVSFMIAAINEDGSLSFKPVGGIDPRVVVGKTLRINEITGVVGYKPIHLQKEPVEKVQYKDLRIYIGTQKREEVKDVKIGDYAYFTTEYEEIGDFAIGKAFDDRVGCSLMIKLIHQSDPVYDTYYIFTVGEEIGLLGSSVVMEQLDLDAAIILEGTTAGDLPSVEKDRWATHLGDGPVLTFFHRGYVIDKRIMESLIEIAEKEKIPYQMKRRTAGGTDAAMIARTGRGAPAGVVSVPCRYIHSPVSVMNKNDYENAFKLIKSLLESEILYGKLR